MKLSARRIATAALALVLIPACILGAQVAPAAGPDSSGLNYGTPKVEFFVGYSYLRAVPTLTSGNRLDWLNGGSTSIAYNFNRYLGVVGDLGGFDDSKFQTTGGANPPSAVNASGSAFTYLFGPRISFRSQSRVTPFAQVLLGDIHASAVTLASGCTVAGCTPLPAESAFAMTAGGGLDLRINHRLALRMIQAEYLMTNFENRDTGLGGSQNDMRLSAGLVLRLGGSDAPPPSVTLDCSASPSAVFAGDPVTVTATAGNLNPRLNVIYSMTGPGLTVNSATATVATATLAPGVYTVNCEVKEGRTGKEGLKPWESAAAATSFAVKAFDPPTISCAASPSAIKPGEESAVTASGVSPQNRPLTYSFSATAGSISGSGSSATYSSAGASDGVVSITCNVTDNKSQTATANTSVTITTPIPLAAAPSPEALRLETRLALHSVFFPTDQPRIGKPEGGLLASQQGTLTTLATDFKSYLEYKPDARLTLTGHADLRGSTEYNKALAERRVVRTKLFLVQQGVPEAKIETLDMGSQQNLTAAEVKEMIEQNPELDSTQREKALHELGILVWAQNRRVDVTLSNAGERQEQSVRLYPFNAADSLTLLDQKNLKPRKKTAATTK